MRNKKHLKSVVCLVMTILMAFSVIFSVTAMHQEIAQTGAAKTVYFRNTDNWSTVNAYVWVKDTSNSVKAWPGEAMTLHEDNIYKYTINGDYDMIIFNNGSAQTKDLDLGQDGYLFDFATTSWEKYADPTPTDPSQSEDNTEEPKPTTPPDPEKTQLVFFKNTAGWSNVNAYMWKDGAGNNGGWPGKPMTNIGDDIWQYEVTGNYDKIIFNNGSTQTGDLSFPGSGYVFDYSTSKWEIYDTSPIVVKSVSTDVASPQYKGSEITATANAVSTEGTVYYKISVKNPSGVTSVLKDFSTAASVKWTPTAVGNYELIFDFKDDKGNENQRTLDYKIEDDSSLAKPVIKKVTPGSSQVKNNTAMNIAVTAGGGKVGTNLLFYKYTVKDASGKTLNVPYYTKNATYTFKPTALGKFTVTVSVQNSENALVERTFEYESVKDVTEPDDPVNPPDPTGVLGDADDDGVLSVMDATLIQRWVAQLINDSQIRLDLSDYDQDSKVSVMDATAIQQKLAGLN